MNFDILHATKERPALFEKMFRGVMKKISGNHVIKYKVGLDSNDKQAHGYKLAKKALKDYNNIEFYTFETKNYVECVNELGKKIENECVIIASDDFEFPDNWDEELSKVIEANREQFGDDYVIDIFDGHQPRIMTIPIFSKKYYERFNYVYYPEYESIYSDTDFTEVAYKLKRVIHARHLLFEHMHHTFNKRLKDKIDEIHSGKARYESGEKIFKKREKRNFDVA